MTMTPARRGSMSIAIFAAIVVVASAMAGGVAFASFSGNGSASGSIGTATLAAPTSLTATNAVQLSWTASTSSFATGSRVLRGTQSGGPYTQITQIVGLATTTYSDSPGAGTFFYVVVAYYSGNGANWTSPNSNEASVTVVVCSAPGTTTLTAATDTYVDQNSRTTNFGGSSTLLVRSLTTQNTRTLVKFTLPSIPSGCTLTTATLQLMLSSGVAGRTLQAYQSASSWAENSVTWNTQPATTGTAATTTSLSTGTDLFTVTSQVSAMYSGTNNGFLVRDASEGASSSQTQTFFSRTGTTPPKLLVTFG